MRILLVNPRCGFFTRATTAPIGLLSIATYLRQNGHEVRFLDQGISRISIKKEITAFKPDIMGVSVISVRSLKNAINLSKKAKECSVPVLWGGHLPSEIPEKLFITGVIDYISIGEGEITILELLGALESGKPLEEVNGLAFIKDGKPYLTPCRELADLAELPVIDWSLTKPEKYFQSYFDCKKMLYLYSAKGCYGSCKFCYNKYFNHGCFRQRPTEYFLSEIEYLQKHHGLDGVYFSDELWGGTREHISEICRDIRNSGLKFTWGAQTRMELFDRENLKEMYDCGCRWLFFGVESGSPEVIKRVGKAQKKEWIEPVITACRELGITTFTSYVIGFPGETAEDLKMTVDLALEVDSNLKPFNDFTPVPGSVMCNELIAEGRYSLPTTVKEIAKMNLCDRVIGVSNYAEVPDRDISVIKAFFMWTSLFNKNSSASKSGGSFAFAKKLIHDTFVNIFRFGLGSFIAGVLGAASQFFTVLWCLTMYPGIRKKYGLYKRRNRQ